MSRWAGAPPTCGANPSSPNAATLSASVMPASEPAMSAEYTDFGSRRLARRWATATDSNQRFLHRSRGLSSHAAYGQALLRHVDRRLGERVRRRGRRVVPRRGRARIRGRVRRAESGEELRGHAPAAALVEQPAARARAGVLGLAQRGEQLRLAPHAREPAALADVAGEELVVDHERARVHVADRIDQAHHPPGPAQVQARQRLAVSTEVKERVAGEHALAVREQPLVQLVAAGRRWGEARPRHRRRGRTAAGGSAAAARGSDPPGA